MDIPGVDDGQLATMITSYIEKQYLTTVPVILIHLTIGGFEEISHFHSLIPTFKIMRVPPTIIFTKLEHLFNDTKARIREEEEDTGDEFPPEEKEKRIIDRATEVISDYMNRVLKHLPEAKFFIFNPNSRVFGYKFVYGP